MGEQVTLDYMSLFGGKMPAKAPVNLTAVKPTSATQNAPQAKTEVNTGGNLAEEKDIFNTAWLTLKQYRHLRRFGNDAEWEQVVAKANYLCKAGTNKATQELAQALSIAVLNYLDAISDTNG